MKTVVIGKKWYNILGNGITFDRDYSCKGVTFNISSMQKRTNSKGTWKNIFNVRYTNYLFGKQIIVTRMAQQLFLQL
ncbi:hypothetical protein D0T53_03160 [Dysgonomonas sp. 216]|nr:hypothetical protein [Dysgonomonas sp. 216]